MSRFNGGRFSAAKDYPLPLQVYNAWVLNGTWQDDVPTSGQSWDSPVNKGNAFTVWDDTEVTA
jgi:hypothetical protein